MLSLSFDSDDGSGLECFELSPEGLEFLYFLRCHAYLGARSGVVACHVRFGVGVFLFRRAPARPCAAIISQLFIRVHGAVNILVNITSRREYIGLSALAQRREFSRKSQVGFVIILQVTRTDLTIFLSPCLFSLTLHLP